MKEYIKVKNWEEFQHYSNRTPPWIKLHNSLLDDYEFECLSDSNKGHLLCIWMLASRTNNKIPNNAQWIKKKIGANSNVDLQSLIDAGFLVVSGAKQDASKMLPNTEQDATKCTPPEEKRREEKTENIISDSVESVPAAAETPPYESIKDLYNEKFPELPECQVLDDKRKASIRGIWRSQLKTLEDWSGYFDYVRNNCTWVVNPKPNGSQNNITWFIRPRNLTAVMNGEYDDN